MLRKAVLALSVALSVLSFSIPLDAQPQRATRVYRIGVLGAGAAVEHAADIDVFKQALQELGWVKERAIIFEERYADGRYDGLSKLATELVALKVQIIFVTGGTPAIEAAMNATREIPIVFSTVGDPVGQKLVKSMAHPGGNVTGFSNMSDETSAKRLAVLKEAVPGIARVGILINGANSATPFFLQLYRSASTSLGLQIEAFDIREFEDFEKIFETMSRDRVHAVIVDDDNVLDASLKQLGSLALKHQLPLMAVNDEIGVLLTYSRDTPALYRRAAEYVDKILKGANPGELPIEQPTKFSLTINVRTANALGFSIPQALLLRANEVIR